MRHYKHREIYQIIDEIEYNSLKFRNEHSDWYEVEYSSKLEMYVSRKDIKSSVEKLDNLLIS